MLADILACYIWDYTQSYLPCVCDVSINMLERPDLCLFHHESTDKCDVNLRSGLIGIGQGQADSTRFFLNKTNKWRHHWIVYS